jgi:hypothetical protein
MSYVVTPHRQERCPSSTALFRVLFTLPPTRVLRASFSNHLMVPPKTPHA